jgi:hypothetical protein
MGLDLNDLQRIVSFTDPAIHPELSYGVVVRKVVSPDHKEYIAGLYRVGPRNPARFRTNGPGDAHPAFSADGPFLWFIR